MLWIVLLRSLGILQKQSLRLNAIMIDTVTYQQFDTSSFQELENLQY